MSNAHDLANELAARINARRADLAESLAKGQAVSWDDYKKQTGIIEGFDQVLDALPHAVTKVTGGQ